MSSLETIIGLEVHAQLSSKTKMFCGCSNEWFGKPPNTTVCPICMGHPGALPVPNASAVAKALRAALALGGKIAPECHFDRKNYFYPDLPAGFQISQYDFPLAMGGFLDLPGGRCRIRRLHLENDAGKLMHMRGKTLCDFNRAGSPLAEIVTEPDLRSAEDAVLFAEELRRILVAVGASDADMEKGMLRFDASISLRPEGEEKLYPRSEIKNLNSFRALERALQSEEQKIRRLWEKDSPPTKEVTVHWDDGRGEGKVLRDKESAADYRYFPEPDIPPLTFDADQLEEIRSSLPPLPQKRRVLYLAAGLKEAEADLLLGSPELTCLFDAVSEASGNPKSAASLILHQLTGFLRAAGKGLEEGPNAQNLLELIRLTEKGMISGNIGKQVLEEMVLSGRPAGEIVAAQGLQGVSDVAILEDLLRKAVAANPKAVEDLRAGKTKAAGAIVGVVMKETKGQADPAKVQEILGRLMKEK